MKKMICTVALASLLCGSAFAASGSYTVAAELNPDIRDQIDGVERTFYNVQGQEVHPISCGGTTYIPLRSIGELMNKNVNWDESSYTATIGGTRTTGNATGTPDRNAKEAAVNLTMEPNYTIVIDGVDRTFYDVNGKVCDPAVYNGSIYLPIRAIGEIMGKSVSWNEAAQTVSLNSNASIGGEVTDFDTSNPATTPPSDPTTPVNPATPSTPAGTITLEQAKQAALKHAGKTAAQVTFVKGTFDYEHGRPVYEVEFIEANGTGYMEYDYEIDASTGAVRSYDFDAENYRPAGNQGSASVGVTVSEARAKELALAKVPGASSANIYKFKLDFDDGRWVYEGDIYYNTMEYEFEIDANTGAFVSWSVESIYD